MKAVKVICVLAAVAMFASTANASLILTGVIDGPLSGGTPKGVEVYVTADIPDMSIYGLGSANNGGGSDGEEFTFPAVAATAGDCIWLNHSSTVDNLATFDDWFGFAPDYSTSAVNINGDDAIELFQNGSVIDTYGVINAPAAGQPWEYMDGWAYRVDGTGPDGTSWVQANWTYSGANALDGETSNATAASPMPHCSYTPEPTTIALLGFAALGLLRRRR